MKKKVKKIIEQPAPAEPIEEPLENQTINQKKMSFVQSAHLDAVLALLRDSCGEQRLVGETEFETIKNAITLEANANMIKGFIKMVDFVKSGGLHQVK